MTTQTPAAPSSTGISRTPGAAGIRNNGAPATLVGGVPVPKNADELAEMMADGGRVKAVLSSKENFQAFVEAYATARQGDGTELQRLVQTELQREFGNWMKANADLDGAQLKGGAQRLNMDPQNRPTSMMTSHRQATAHNPKAPGAALDAEFTSAPEYFKAAWHLNSDSELRAKMERIRNAYSSVVPSEGGFLVPETLRSQLLQIALESSVVRARATVVPMESARVPFPMIDSTTNSGSVFGGMIGYWGEESATLTESSAKFGRAVLDAKKLTGFAAVPNELLADSLISFAALIESLWPQALSFFEDVAFMTGSGVGEPLGFLGNPAAIAVAKETGQAATSLVFENIVKMYSRMLPSSLNRAIWVVAPNVLPELFTMALSVGTGGGPVYVSNAQGPAPVTIFGRPVVVSEKARTLGSQGDIAFVDLAYYLVGDRQTMSASSSMDYRFGQDQTAFRIIQRVDGMPWLKDAITPQNGATDTLSPFVELAAR
jgi:HK97 family phage major capsid protein